MTESTERYLKMVRSVIASLTPITLLQVRELGYAEEVLAARERYAEMIARMLAAAREEGRAEWQILMGARNDRN